MNFSDINITFSETGSVKIRVNVKLKERFTVFENTPAIADGTIKAEIYQHEQCVGTALLTAPIDGIDTSFGLGTRLEGVILSDNNTAKRYERYYVKFSPYHLWKIEV